MLAEPTHDEDRAVINLCGNDWLLVCAPMGMQREVVERQMNAARLVNGPWRIARCEHNPYPCHFEAGRLHWYLSRGPQA
jgi:hypothetical protein